MSAESDWNQRYASGDAPWDVGLPDEHLERYVADGRLEGTRVLEIGCGTGTNALWLAARGYEVLGVDVASRAVEQARAKAKAAAEGTCAFEHLDFLEVDPPGAPFDFVFDRGCFHIFDHAPTRERFARRVGALLRPEGCWLSLIGSTEGPAREEGPPRRSALEVAAAIEPSLELVDLRQVFFTSRQAVPALAWLAVSRKRLIPPQPSTRRP